MRVVVQRVSEASVEIDGKIKSSIAIGLMVLVGIEEADTEEDSDWLAGKITGLRIFDDENGVMNRSVTDVKSE
jgi:D-tyrosyl-tRNA(Tyr) deacylase